MVKSSQQKILASTIISSKQKEKVIEYKNIVRLPNEKYF